MTWQPIETAPKDGVEIQARIPGHGSDNVIAWCDGVEGSDGISCGAWMLTRDQEPPDDWTDGVCWLVNADGQQSIAPTHWQTLSRSRQMSDESKRAECDDCRREYERMSAEELEDALMACTVAAPRLHAIKALRAHIAALEAEILVRTQDNITLEYKTAAERERCAKIADREAAIFNKIGEPGHAEIAEDIAAAIRRGEE
mgnify:FL=1